MLAAIAGDVYPHEDDVSRRRAGGIQGRAQVFEGLLRLQP
jgi:hypothetical protein